MYSHVVIMASVLPPLPLWQVERVLHLKFPGEVYRAGEAGFVSCNMCLTILGAQCVYTNT